MANSPCYKCPDRWAECHAHCEKWLVYEKERNAEYERIAKIKEQASIIYSIERDRKRDIAKGKMSQRGRKK